MNVFDCGFANYINFIQFIIFAANKKFYGTEILVRLKPYRTDHDNSTLNTIATLVYSTI